jgi:hypothetical protein
MPSLRLLSIHCQTTEDVTGPDEPYILVGFRQVWGSQGLNDRENEDLGNIPAVPFRTNARLSLYDQDVGGLVDDDDFLGTWIVRASEQGQGETEARFNGDGADYTITYEVIPGAPN